MLDYGRIVDEIRSLLECEAEETIDFVRATAGDYAVACDEVNERLRQCGGLMKKGLRSEAIRLCEIEPNLLDAVALLDLPERKPWEAMLRKLRLATPAPLLIDTAAELNEAYALNEPLAALLQRHRLLALARGPLALRIKTLRELAEIDTTNAFWRADLAVYEEERRKQIRQETAKALEARDLAVLTALEAELNSEGWVQPPPTELVQRIADAREVLEREQVKRDLEHIAKELVESLASLDGDRGRALRTQWESLSGVCGLSEGDPLAQLAAPALAWLDQDDDKLWRLTAHREALAALEDALDRDKSATILTARYRVAVDDGDPLPLNLERRYQDRLKSLRGAAARRRWLRVAVVAAGVTAVAAIIGAIVFYQVETAAVAAHAAEIQSRIAKGKLSEAQEYLERLTIDSPRRAKDAQIRSLGAELTALIEKEHGRTQRVAKLTAGTDEALVQFDREGGTARNPLERAERWAAIRNAQREALKQAKELAKTDDEKAKVSDLELALAKRDADAQAAIDREVRNEIETLTSELDKLDQSESPDVEAQQRATAEFGTKLTTMEEGVGRRASAEVQAQIKPLSARWRSLRSRLDQRTQEEFEVQRITNAIGEPRAFKEALEEYVQKFPDSNRSAAFRKAAEESALWEGTAAWNSVIVAWRSTDLPKLSPSLAAERVKLAREVLKAYADYPNAEAFERRLPYVETIAERSAERERLEGKLAQLFQDPLVGKLWMVEATMAKEPNRPRRRFYLAAEPQLDAGKAANSFKYLTGFDRAEQNISDYHMEQVVSGLAPQARVAEAVNKLLAGLSSAGWEPTLGQIIATLQADEQMDPLLKLTLLQQTLEVACQGSPSIAKAFAPHVAALKKAGIDPLANWLDPFNADADRARTRAATVLRQLPGAAAAAKAALDDYQALYQKIGVVYRWVGWLYRDGSGKWRCPAKAPPEQSGALLVASRGGTWGGATFASVGRVDRGLITLDASPGNRLLEGRPVYFAEP